MNSPLKEWARHRRRLERETQILVVEDDLATRRRFDDFLYRHRIAARSVATPEEALELLDQNQHPLVLVSETLSGLGGLYFIRKLRQDYPSVCAILTATDPGVELISKAFELRVLDVIRKPLAHFELFGQRVREGIHRSVDRRMQGFVLVALREQLQQLDPETRLRATTTLEQRLNGFKTALGRFNRVLVVEDRDSELRLLGENLLMADMTVELTSTHEEALARVSDGKVHLLAVPGPMAQEEMTALMGQVRDRSPLTELMLISPDGDDQLAIDALRHGLALYLPWPPASPSAMVLRIKDILHQCLRDRLMENLLAELFVETNRVGTTLPSEESFEAFRTIAGLKRISQPPRRVGLKRVDSGGVAYLDEVLDHLLADDSERHLTQEVIDEESAAEAQISSRERREHLRVAESQFVRFRPEQAPASKLALVGDLSVGGLFIRTSELETVGTEMELEVNAEYRGQGYLIRCRGQVAWVAMDNSQFVLGPGFGVKFLAPPPDVQDLIERIISERLSEHR